MCMFCASVPAIIGIGVAARANQRENTPPETKTDAQFVIPAGRATAAAIVAVLAAAVVVHTQTLS